MRLQGTTGAVMPEPPRCAFPSCSDWAEHDHHITYDPPVTKRLCVRHHEEITIINGQQSRKYGHKILSNKHRWWIWFQWIEGKLKARRTKKALEYTGEWAAVATKREEAEKKREGIEENKRKRISFTFPAPSPERSPRKKRQAKARRTSSRK